MKWPFEQNTTCTQVIRLVVFTISHLTCPISVTEISGKPHLVGVDRLGSLEHEPESFGASDLSPVGPDVEIHRVERRRACAGGLAGEGSNAYVPTWHEKGGYSSISFQFVNVEEDREE